MRGYSGNEGRRNSKFKSTHYKQGELPYDNPPLIPRIESGVC